MKRFVTVENAGTSKESNSKKSKLDGLVQDIQYQREKTATSGILDFNFKKKRCRVLSKVSEIGDNKNGIVYWMSRDARVQDNWALLYAQKLALKNDLPLHIIFCLVPKFLDATIRHYKFLLQGLQEVFEECKLLNISFHLLPGMANKELPKFVKKHSIGAVVTDFSPLRVPLKWVEDVKNSLPADVALVQVDSHNIVPVWITSEKQEYAARTIRNKINSKLDEWLTEFPPVILHPHKSVIKPEVIDWEKTLESVDVDRSVDEVKWAQPGYKAGIAILESFIETRLKIYTDKRNDPTLNALSNLSPWLHFGHISAQRCVLAVKSKSKNSAGVAAFCEEAIVRRELSDNFCYYNKRYDSLDGISDWAKTSLDLHKKDKRPYLYTLKELEQSKTHDDLWNSAQIQMVKEGKMHGFLRMYWAKKILEWTETPERALEIAIYLNDRYSLDGRDPNGYVGCMWSIGGIHDQGWAERSVFGKIRYMNYAGCKRKFDLKAFVARFGGKEYHKK